MASFAFQVLAFPQAIPEAASLLATARNVQAKAPELAALERWAPAPLLEATALLAGASGGDSHVRAYALRSLTTASKPEEVSMRPARGCKGDVKGA